MTTQLQWTNTRCEIGSLRPIDPSNKSITLWYIRISNYFVTLEDYTPDPEHTDLDIFSIHILYCSGLHDRCERRSCDFVNLVGLVSPRQSTQVSEKYLIK